MARTLWERDRTTTKYSTNRGKIVLMRRPDGKIMKGPNFKPPVFHHLIKRIGSPTNNPVEKYWSMSNTALFANMINQVKEFHTMFGHHIGMVRWDNAEGTPG